MHLLLVADGKLAYLFLLRQLLGKPCHPQSQLFRRLPPVRRVKLAQLAPELFLKQSTPPLYLVFVYILSRLFTASNLTLF